MSAPGFAAQAQAQGDDADADSDSDDTQDADAEDSTDDSDSNADQSADDADQTQDQQQGVAAAEDSNGQQGVKTPEQLLQELQQQQQQNQQQPAGLPGLPAVCHRAQGREGSRRVSPARCRTSGLAGGRDRPEAPVCMHVSQLHGALSISGGCAVSRWFD